VLKVIDTLHNKRNSSTKITFSLSGDLSKMETALGTLFARPSPDITYSGGYSNYHGTYGYIQAEIDP